MHCPVIVFGPDVHDKLEPFSCDNEEYFQSKDVTEEVMAEIEKHAGFDFSTAPFESALTMVSGWHGYMVITESQLEEDGELDGSYVLIDDARTEIKQIIRFSNENAKWDWFAEGGRYSDYFRVKDGADASDYEAGLDTFDNPTPKEGYADAARKRAIDFDKENHIPVAFIDLDGNWHGKYLDESWMSAMPEEEWKKEVCDYINSVPDDTWMAIVDCHY